MKQLQPKLRGTGVALVTPFNKKNEPDLPALAKLVNHVLKGKCEYVVVLGTTGESVTLNKQEKQSVLDTVVTAVKSKVPVILGLGGNNTDDLIASIGSFNLKGVDAFLSVSPFYNKPSQEGIIAHYRAFAKASPLPILLYNVPGRTGTNMLAETTLTLAKEKNIIGIKEACGNMNQFMELIQKRPVGFLVISGDDDLALAQTAMGADGVISVVANAWPSEFSEMIRQGLKSNLDKARKLHYRLLPVVPLLFREGNPAGIKYVLNEMNICDERVRLPLVSVSKHLGKELSSFLKKSK
jgi:4-hydroxy-tetrahydrodipicolinate synthase